MKLFTSYYANYKNIPSNYLCIGISRVCPEWFANANLPNFIFIKSNFMAPSFDLLNDSLEDKEAYKRRYVTELYSNLSKLGYNDLKTWVNDLFKCEAELGFDGIVFMCYEAPDKFCHRHIVRKILNNVYNIDCKEFGIEENTGIEIKNSKNNSKNLF